MHVNNPLRIFVGGFVLCVFAGTMLARPPEVDFDEIERYRTLSPKHLEQLRARIGYWLEVIRSAAEAKDITDAREELLKDFQRSDKVLYRDSFAGLASQLAIPLFARLPEGLKNLREVNLALALSQFPQVTVQPALEDLIVHPNPAVRFLGWRGYRRIRPQVLARPPGTQFDQAMYRSMWARAAEESVAPVVSAIFQMIQMPPVRREPVSAENFPRFQENAFQILKDTWERRCREVLRGDGAMADACRKGTKALENLEAVFKDDPVKRKAILQMVIDMTWCAARAYDSALRTVNQAARNQQKNEAAQQSLQANSELLRDCEKTLNALTRRDSRHIVRPMSDPDQLDRGSAVGLGVVEWIKDLQAEGVTNPEPRFSAQPTTQPPGQAKAGQ